MNGENAVRPPLCTENIKVLPYAFPTIIFLPATSFLAEDRVVRSFSHLSISRPHQRLLYPVSQLRSAVDGPITLSPSLQRNSPFATPSLAAELVQSSHVFPTPKVKSPNSYIDNQTTSNHRESFNPAEIHQAKNPLPRR
jgi:hypothetical protein